MPSEGSEFPEAGVTHGVSCLMWVLGAELSSFASVLRKPHTLSALEAAAPG